MKKILVAMIMAMGLMVVSASADSGIRSGLNVGYTNMSIGDVSGNGGHLGYDFGIPIFTNTRVRGLNVGAEMELQWVIMEDNAYTNESVGGVTGGLFVGYRKHNLYTKVGGDYQYVKVTDSTYLSGFVPNIRVGYDFSRKFGIEASYKTGTLDVDGNGQGVDVDTIGITLTIHTR
jgi:hypothetical protein